MIWKPHVTVATVLERDGLFLLVEENTDDGIRYNQPAGHLEFGEALSDAAIRETLEETGYTCVPDALVGIYQWRKPERDLSYLRFAFSGRVLAHDARRQLDEDIIAAHWLTPDEIRARQAQLRSPMVMRCID
ncbi:MAG: NUDIX hydrolase, partial [Propionivibrio sp.]|nr:NUDIX hydrolase [Propionivibrio sp.]